MANRVEHSVPAPIVAVAGWLLPGSGYFLIGQRARALAVGITIIVLFILGLLIGGVRVVDPPKSYADNPINVVFQKPWFVGQILTGPITLITAAIGGDDEPANNFPVSHARPNEIGTLYTAVAGMLNLLALIDSAYRAAHRGENT